MHPTAADRRATALLQRVGQPPPAWAVAAAAAAAAHAPSRRPPPVSSPPPPPAPPVDAPPASPPQLSLEDVPALVAALVGPSAGLELARACALPPRRRGSSAGSVQALPGFLAVDEAALPLHLFDAADDAPCVVGVAGVASLEYHSGWWRWAPVAVRAHDAAAGTYDVEFDSGGRRRRVRALDLCVDAASDTGRRAHARRLCAALARRGATVAGMRQRHFIASMAPSGGGCAAKPQPQQQQQGEEKGEEEGVEEAGEPWRLARIAASALAHRRSSAHRASLAALARLRAALRQRTEEAASAAREAGEPAAADAADAAAGGAEWGGQDWGGLPHGGGGDGSGARVVPLGVTRAAAPAAAAAAGAPASMARRTAASSSMRRRCRPRQQQQQQQRVGGVFNARLTAPVSAPRAQAPPSPPRQRAQRQRTRGGAHARGSVSDASDDVSGSSSDDDCDDSGAADAAAAAPLAPSPSALLAAAVAEPAVGALLAEVVAERRFASRAAAVLHAVAAAAAAAGSSGGGGGGGGGYTRGALRGAHVGPAAAAAQRLLAARYAELALPPPRPPPRPPAHASAAVPYGAPPGDFATSRRALADALHLRGGGGGARHGVARLLGELARLWRAQWHGRVTVDLQQPSPGGGGEGAASGGGGGASRSPPPALALSDWRARQRAAAHAASERLLGTWHRDVVNAVMDRLPPSDARFNMFELEPAAYAGSDLARLLRRVELSMQAQLLELAGGSCDALRAWLGGYCPPAAAAGGGSGGGGGNGDGAARCIRPLHALAFDLQLKLVRRVAGGSSGGGGVVGTAADDLSREEAGEQPQPQPQPQVAASGAVASSASGSDGGGELASDATADAHGPPGDDACAHPPRHHHHHQFFVRLDPSPTEIYAHLAYPLSALAGVLRRVPGVQGRVCTLLRPCPQLVAAARPLVDAGRPQPQPQPQQQPQPGALPGDGDEPPPAGRHADALIDAARAWLAGALHGPLLARPAALAEALSAHAWLADVDARAVVADAAEAAAAAAVAAPASASAGGGGGPPAPPGAPPPDDVALLAARARTYHAAARALATAAADVEDCGLFRVHTAGVRGDLAAKAAAVRDALLAHLLASARAQADALHAAYGDLAAQLAEPPRSEAEWAAAAALARGAAGAARTLDAGARRVLAAHDACGEFGHAVPAADAAHAWALRRWPQRIALALAEHAATLAVERARLCECLEEAQRRLEGSLEALDARVGAYKDAGPPGLLAAAEEAEAAAGSGSGCGSSAEPLSPRLLAVLLGGLPRLVSQGAELDAELRGARERGAELNARRSCLGAPPVACAAAGALAEALEPFARLWAALSDLLSRRDAWLGAPLAELDAAGCAADAAEWASAAGALARVFGDAYRDAAAGARCLRALAAALQAQLLPLLRALVTRSLAPRHWAAVGALLQLPLEGTRAELTLAALLAAGGGRPAEAAEIARVAAQADVEAASEADAAAAEAAARQHRAKAEALVLLAGAQPPPAGGGPDGGAGLAAI